MSRARRTETFMNSVVDCQTFNVNCLVVNHVLLGSHKIKT